MHAILMFFKSETYYLYLGNIKYNALDMNVHTNLITFWRHPTFPPHHPENTYAAGFYRTIPTRMSVGA